MCLVTIVLVVLAGTEARKARKEWRGELYTVLTNYGATTILSIRLPDKQNGDPCLFLVHEFSIGGSLVFTLLILGALLQDAGKIGDVVLGYKNNGCYVVS
jgi:hypothetical protein